MRINARFSALLLTLLTIASGVHAQELTSTQESTMASMSMQETISLLVGDIVEILPSHSITDPSFTWILTQDRTFIEAGRAPIFRKRLIQPGRYSLYAEISSGDKSINITRTFILDYKARQPGQIPATPAAQGNAMIVVTNPTLGSAEQVVLPEGKQLLQLIPINQEVRPLALDLNSAIDNDQDGNPANDIQSDLTFFQTDASPIFIWFAEPVSDTTLVVSAAAPDNQSTQRIRVVSPAVAGEQGLFESPLKVTIEPSGERQFTFKAEFEIPPPSSTLLYQWEFGDGQQSLQMDPVHTYAEAGDYAVMLRVRNLANGEEIASYEETISIQATDSTSSTASSESTTPSNGTNEGTSFSWGSIMLLVGIFIASILAGVAVMFVIAWLRRRGGKSLSDRIEQMEQTVLGKEETPEAAKAPATLTIAPPAAKPAQPPKDIAQREKENMTPNPLQQKPLAVEEKNAPAWLKSGLTSAPATVTPATPAPSAPVQTPATPPAPKAPAPTPPKPVAEASPKAAPPQAPTTPANVPPWLQKTTPAPTPAPSTPASQPQAQPKPTPATPVTPPAPPAPKASAPASVPPWLQTPTPAPAPTPPKPVQAPVVQVPLSEPPAIQKSAAPEAPIQTTPPAAASPTPVPTPLKEVDEPIAFIRADSLDTQQHPEPPMPGAPS